MKSIGYEELTPEQDTVLHAPLGGVCVTSGGPGTGKSTLAIYRALLHVAAGDTPIIVVPDQLRRICLAKRLENQSAPVQVLLPSELVRKMAPGLPAGLSMSDSDFWVQAMVALVQRRRQLVGSSWALLMDDAHDMPPGLHDLATLYTPKVTVFHDESTVHSSTQTPAEQLSTAYPEAVQIELRQTHRWTRSTAELAAGLIQRTKLPEVSDERGQPLPVRAINLPHHANVALFVARLFGRNPGGRIAVTCRSDEGFRILSAHLRHTLKNERSYTPIGRGLPPPKPSAARPGVWLLKEGEVRGLEFDTVVITEIDSVVDDVTKPGYRVPLYRAIASARDQVILTWSRPGGADQTLALLGSAGASIQIESPTT